MISEKVFTRSMYKKEKIHLEKEIIQGRKHQILEKGRLNESSNDYCKCHYKRVRICTKRYTKISIRQSNWVKGVDQ